MSGFPNQHEQFRLLEYNALRQEMQDNKKFVFERPFIIIGGIGLAALQLQHSTFIWLLPSFFVFLLCLNLAFTANRLLSNARISGYLSAIVEPSVIWVGWENALRLYRAWSNAKTPLRKSLESEEYNDKRAQSDRMLFFFPLLMLHVVPAVFAIISFGWAYSNAEKGEQVIQTITLWLTLASAVYFLFLVLWKFLPYKMSARLEIERSIWLAVHKWHLEQQKEGVEK
jgi:small-conductance mechanosensitive channel